jgi:HAD superfamily phosphoserine phosphatase-like hydrolase
VATAVFDVDHTLAPMHVGARFLRHACAAKAVSRPACLGMGAILGLYRAHLLGAGRATAMVHDMLIGAAYSRLAALADEFVAREVVPKVFREAREAIARHLATGDTVVLASGSPDFVIRALGSALDLTHVIATSYVLRQDRIAGVQSPLPFGEGKCALVKERGFLGDADIQVYSDDAADLPLFRLASFAWLVNPHPALVAAARQERLRFEVLNWSDSPEEHR